VDALIVWRIKETVTCDQVPADKALAAEVVRIPVPSRTVISPALVKEIEKMSEAN